MTELGAVVEGDSLTQQWWHRTYCSRGSIRVTVRIEMIWFQFPACREI
jgi:hypothetical protein